MIALDNQVLVWGVRRQATEGSDLVRRTERWLAQLSDDGEEVIVPAPVLAEFLHPLPSAKHPAAVATLRRYFRIADLDAKAAAKAAEIAHRNLKDAQAISGSGKQCLKADALILGVAIVSGADRIASHDSDMRSMADGIPIRVIEAIVAGLDVPLRSPPRRIRAGVGSSRCPRVQECTAIWALSNGSGRRTVAP